TQKTPVTSPDGSPTFGAEGIDGAPGTEGASGRLGRLPLGAEGSFIPENNFPRNPTSGASLGRSEVALSPAPSGTIFPRPRSKSGIFRTSPSFTSLRKPRSASPDGELSALPMPSAIFISCRVIQSG